MLRIVSKGRTAMNIKRLKSLSSRTKKAVRKTFIDVKPYVKSRSLDLMTQSKSGNAYHVYVSKTGRRLKRGRAHRASSKNEPFALMSGATFRSLRQVVSGWQNMEVGFNTIQGKVWEKTGRTVLKRVLHFRQMKKEFDNAFRTNLTREMHRK